MSVVCFKFIPTTISQLGVLLIADATVLHLRTEVIGNSLENMLAGALSTVCHPDFFFGLSTLAD
jgi:hypothetical protein